MARQDLEKAQSLINAMEAQRNGAFNQAAQMQVAIDDLQAEIKELKDQLIELNKEVADGLMTAAEKKGKK
jgi:SMC interacting uncharacterized protein involved in chromosome segregation